MTKLRANNDKKREFEDSGRVGGKANMLHMPIRLEIASRILAHKIGTYTGPHSDVEFHSSVIKNSLVIADALIAHHNKTCGD